MPERGSGHCWERPQLSQPQQVHRFWLDVVRFENVRDLINSAHLSTMMFGVESRQDEAPELRQRLKEIMTEPGNPLRDEQQRALEVGFLYGALLIRRSTETPAVPKEDNLPTGFMDAMTRVKDGLALTELQDNIAMFVRLHDLEETYTDSHALAEGLAVIEGHMTQEFINAHRGEDQLSRSDTTNMFTLFYGGMLVGALASFDNPAPDQTA